MKTILVVVDMQNDFVDGVLGTKEAVAMIPQAVKTIQGFKGEIYFTQDTHQKDYLSTQEGKKLPVLHCVEGTRGWDFYPAIKALVKKHRVFKKNTFGSRELAEHLKELNQKEKIESISLLGICTDICVISNAMMIKAFLPEVPIKVVESACAGVTQESHKNALKAMQSCQIDVI